MTDELERDVQKYLAQHEDEPPYLVTIARKQVETVAAAIDYVQSRKPTIASEPVQQDIGLILRLARRFHQFVLALRKHPRGSKTIEVKNEWNCQQIFRAILAAYFEDIRLEEWNPSVAGTSARCEFFLKDMRTMIELKYARRAGDGKKIKSELALDFVGYGGNAGVDHLVCLVYDPNHVLEHPAALRTDLSGPKAGLCECRCGDLAAEGLTSMTKLNFNSAVFSDGLPVALRFADLVDEILTAGPTEAVAPLPFKFYI